jgi:hypothetical protein
MSIFLGDYSIHGKRPSAEEELAKHGSHNQKTHGGGGGSGGGSGGGNAPSQAALDAAYRSASKVASIKRDIKKGTPYTDEGKRSLTTAERHLDNARYKSPTVTEMNDNLNKANVALDKAELQFEDGNYHSIARAIREQKAIVTSIIKENG